MILSLAKEREFMGLMLFLVQIIPEACLVVWYQTAQVVQDSFAETIIAIGEGLTPFIIISVVVSIVIVEGWAMLYESFARRLRKRRFEEGRATERKQWQAWYETAKAATEAGKPLPDPPREMPSQN